MTRHQHPHQIKEKRHIFFKHILLPRTILTILFTFIVFIILVITMFLVGLIMLLLVQTQILAETSLANFHYMPIIIFAIVSIVIGTLVTTLFSSIPLKPVHILIEGMDQLAHGNFDARITLGNNQLAQRLENSFNQMAEELGQTEMLRSDFINNFSHEFKTPIMSIRGFAKLLQKNHLPEEKRAEYLAIIIDEMTRLADLSTNALNLTKIENQIILTEVTSFNLSEQLRNSILLLEQKWAQKQLRILPEFDEYTIDANEELLKQVWINLLDNAIKFSPENKSIRITLEAIDEFYHVNIYNTGPVIEEENLRKLFNKYWQADSSHSGSGSGIGLSIAKSVVDLHNGQIIVDSRPQWTRFSVNLPQHAESQPHYNSKIN
ncbi:ATP-binding protein [Fundicoccus sp. Sow4_F4]|uniref:HAMP domain-containing sensor histidine kinase n=1 Tax=Fundicoccus sp. Sow4_F4 TaxID=3438783 RepID=UPI003F8F5E76